MVLISPVDRSTGQSLSGEVATDRQRVIGKQMWVASGQMTEEQRLRHIGKLAVITQLFHITLALLVERVKYAVTQTIELQRRHLEYPAQRQVKRRRGLDPAALKVQLGVAVHGEHFTAQHFQQSWSGQMIAYIGQADACRDAAMAGAGSQQSGFGHAVAFAS